MATIIPQRGAKVVPKQLQPKMEMKAKIAKKKVSAWDAIKSIPSEMGKTYKQIGNAVAAPFRNASQVEMRHAETTSPGKFTEPDPKNPGKLRWKK
jgi:hypothetical protein